MSKTIVSVLSIVLILVGAFGFFSDPLFGVFAVDPLHNIVHLLTGVLGLLAITMEWEQLFSRVFGVVYAAVAALGFFTGGVFGMIMVNTADNVLHLVLALVFLYLGFMAASEESAPSM